MTRSFAAGVLATLFALLFSVSTRADSALDLDQYHGKVVVVDFWASWCVPCRRSFPWLNQMQRKYGDDGLVIVGINVDASQADAQSFLAEYPVDFHIVSDPDGELATQFEVMAMPSSYVFGRDGGLITRHLGFKVKKQAEYEETLKSALAARAEARHEAGTD